jgi:hypothetical protein
LREAGLRAEHVAFSFMKRRVQPLMARDTLGYQYMGDEDTSRMPGDEVDDEDIVERLGKIFKDMPLYTPCPVLEDTADEPTERSHSPAPTVEKLVSRMTQQATRVAEPQVPAEESRPEPSATTGSG